MGRLFIYGFTNNGYRLFNPVLWWSIVNGTVILWCLFRTFVFPDSRIPLCWNTWSATNVQRPHHCCFQTYTGIVEENSFTAFSQLAGSARELELTFIFKATANFRNKHTGMMSLVTTLLMFLGGVARIFTSIQETNDPIMIINFSSGAFMSFILLCQFGLYAENTRKLTKKD